MGYGSNGHGEVLFNLCQFVAIGVNRDGYREILGVAEGSREDAGKISSVI